MSALNKNQASIGALLMSAKCQQQTFSLSLDIIDSVPETVRKLAGRHHETSPPEILAPGGGCRFTIRNIKYYRRQSDRHSRKADRPVAFRTTGAAICR